jgi:hypothetical protein
MIHTFLFRELRDSEGNQPATHVIQDGKSYGAVYGSDELRQLYWTPRALCILEGSVKRSVNSGYWVDRALSYIKKGDDVVISDMRFINEAAKVKAHGESIETEVVTVRIERFDDCPSQDPSERDLDNYGFDRKISNRGSLDDLEMKLAFLLDEYELNGTLARTVK